MDADARTPERPKLRALDVIRVPDRSHGLVTVLRDGEGVGKSLVVPPPLDRALPFMNGRRTAREIASEVRRRGNEGPSPAEVAQLATALDEAWLLEGPRYLRRARELREAFARETSRVASHAGGAYHDDPKKLADYIESACLARGARPPDRSVRALVAPHMDLWRAAQGYGSAYRALESGLDPRADTFVLLGTCHAGMREPFAVSPKTFETPLGPLAPDRSILRALADESRFDVLADEYQHKNEHSIEFQAVFLRHLLGHERARASTIVPILCGLGRAQARQTDPARDDEAESFVAALSSALAARPGRVVVIAGADLAHVGPRFGDPSALDDSERRALDVRDRETLARALDADAPGFFAHSTEDLETRRICGVGPVYTLLRLLSPLDACGGKLHHYTQHVDPEEGSIVSHASLSFGAA